MPTQHTPTQFDSVHQLGVTVDVADGEDEEDGVAETASMRAARVASSPVSAADCRCESEEDAPVARPMRRRAVVATLDVQGTSESSAPYVTALTQRCTGPQFGTERLTKAPPTQSSPGGASCKADVCPPENE